MKELEDNVLEKLTSVEGSLVEDEGLIHVLQDTKTTAEQARPKNASTKAIFNQFYVFLGQQETGGRLGDGSQD